MTTLAPARPVPRTDSRWIYSMPARRDAVSTARKETVRFCEQKNIPADVTDDIALVISELATNSLEHADHGRAITVILHTYEEKIYVAVTDNGDAHHPNKDHLLSPEEHGRGLLVIEQLSQSSGRNTTPFGQISWAILSIAPPPKLPGPH